MNRAQPLDTLAPVTARRKDGKVLLAWHLVARRPLLVLGAITTIAFVLVAAAAPMLAPHDPIQQDLALRLRPPGTLLPNGQLYLLGTDQLGRDVLSRLIAGSRVSLLVAALSVLIGLIMGSALGLSAGYFGHLLDSLVMRIADIQMAFPFLFLALIIVALFGRGTANLVLVLAVWGWVSYARVARAMTLSLREREFVQAARAIGANDSRIIVRHLLPNISDTLLVLASLQVGRILVAQAGMEFLGLGVPPPQPIWGGMLSDGRNYLSDAWWISTFPGLTITVVVAGLNFLGDGLRQLSGANQG